MEQRIQGSAKLKLNKGHKMNGVTVAEVNVKCSPISEEIIWMIVNKKKQGNLKKKGHREGDIIEFLMFYGSSK